VTDGNLITAGSSSSAEFAYHILRKLAVLRPDHIEYWYGYFGKHSAQDMLALIGAMQATRA